MTETPFTSIRIFLNPQVFFFRIQKFFPFTRSVFKSNSPVHTHPMVSRFTVSSAQGSSAVKFVQSMGHKARDRGKIADVPPYWLLFGKNFLRRQIKKYPDLPVHMLSDSLRFIFPILESGFENIRIRCRIPQFRVDGSRIQKEKVADSKISG